jgi:hypothetical protein
VGWAAVRQPAQPCGLRLTTGREPTSIEGLGRIAVQHCFHLYQFPNLIIPFNIPEVHLNSKIHRKSFKSQKIQNIFLNPLE